MTDKHVNATNQAPGKILPKGQIELHSLIAHKLFHGDSDSSKRRKTPCFLQYASQLNGLWDYSLKDDPYADAKLLDIEAKMSALDDQLHECDRLLDEGFEKLSEIGLTTELGRSEKPVVVDLSFRTVHAAASAQLLGRLDRVIRKALSLKHFGQLDQKRWQHIRSQSVSPMRELFAQSRYRYSGLSRDNIASMNSETKQTLFKKLGKLPNQVLEGALKPQLGPRR